MTEKEIRRQIDECERQIIKAGGDLFSAARKVGESAKETAESKKASKTVLPLLLSVLGIILMGTGGGFLGFVMLAGGIVWAWGNHDRETAIVNIVEKQRATLDSALNQMRI